MNRVTQLIRTYGLLYLIFTVTCVATLFAFRTKTQSWYFQDETDHVAMGWMMNSFDRDLYTDLSTNHQPIPILLSRVLLTFLSYETLFQLVERVRLAMFFFAAVQGLLLIARFRVKGLITSALILSISYYFLGFHLLAESLVSFPLAFLLLLFLEQFFESKSTRHSLDPFLTGICLFYSAFTLLPLIPVLAILGCYFLFIFNTKEKIVLLSTLLASTVCLFVLVHPYYWFQETIINNWLYFISPEDESFIVSLLHGALLPFQMIMKPNTIFGLFFLVTMATFILFGFKHRPNKTESLKVLLVVLLLMLLNLRVFDNLGTPYTIFHYLPFMAAYIAMFATIVAYFFKESKKTGKVIIGALLVLFLLSNLRFYLEKTDKVSQYYIEYNRFTTVADVITITKDSNSTLLSGPDGHGYINMLAKTPIAGRQLFHLPWSWNSPSLQAEFNSMMTDQPPTFIFFDFTYGGGYDKAVKDNLKKHYYIFEDDTGKATQLYIHKSSVDRLTSEQYNQLESRHKLHLEPVQ